MKIITSILFLLFTLISQGQNKIELEQIQIAGRHNLVPMYGKPYIEKDIRYIEADNKFLETIDKDFDSRTNAAIKYVHLGYNYFYKGDLKSSMKRFNQAWLLDTSNAGIYFGFWLIQNVLNSPSELSKYFEMPSIQLNNEFNADKYYYQGIKLDKENEYENLALDYACSSFSDFGKSEKGLQSCLIQLEKNKTDTITLQNLATVYTNLNEWNKALEIHKRSLSYRKNIAFVYNDIGWAFQEMNSLDSAATYYLNAIKHSGISYFKPRINYCLLMEKTNKCNNAIPVIDNCINALPTEGFFHYTKGKLLMCSGRKEEALKLLKTAKKLGNEEAKSLLKELKK